MRLKTIKFNGFTLAETLITLVVIGIAAAITVPTLITKYQKEQTVTKLKKVYNILHQSILLSERENGNIDSWDFINLDGDVFFDKYIRKYLNIMEKEQKVLYTVKHSKSIGNRTEASYLSTGNISYYIYIYKLTDGTIISLENWGYSNEKDYKVFFIDINGLKGPNKIGRDIFYMKLSKNNFDRYKNVPALEGVSWHYEPTKKYSREQLLNNINQVEDCNHNGIACFTLIMRDNWIISDDYPW